MATTRRWDAKGRIVGVVSKSAIGKLVVSVLNGLHDIRLRGGWIKAPPMSGNVTITLGGLSASTTLAGVSSQSRTGTLTPTVVSLPPSYTSQPAEIRRFDGGTGLVLVSSGVPLLPGTIFPADIGKVRVTVLNVEQACAVTALKGKFPDGSLRSVLVQFFYTVPNATPISAIIWFGIPRSTVDIPAVPVTWANLLTHARLLPINTDYLCATEITQQPLVPVSQDDVTTYNFDTQLQYEVFNTYKLRQFRDGILGSPVSAGSMSLHITGPNSIYWLGDTDAIRGQRMLIGTFPTSFEFVYVSNTYPSTLNPFPLSTATTKAWPAGTPVQWSPVQKEKSGVFGQATYDSYRGLAAAWCRTGDTTFLAYALDFWHEFVAGYDTPDAAYQPAVNSEGFPVWNYNGVPQEWHGVTGISHAVMYWLTGWEQCRKNWDFHRNWVMGEVTSQAQAISLYDLNTNDRGYIHKNAAIRYNVARMWRPVMGYTLECKTQYGGAFGSGRVPTYTTELSWVIDAIATHQYATADVRNGLNGLSITNTESRWPGAPDSNHSISLAPGQLPNGGFACFQVSTINELLLYYYRYVYPDSRIPNLIKKNCDCIILQASQNTVNDEYKPPPLCWQTTYEAEKQAGGGTPFSIPMHRNHFYWVYHYTGDPTYKDWADKITNPAAEHQWGGYAPKEYGELFGTTQATGAYRAGAAIRPAWAPTVIVEP